MRDQTRASLSTYMDVRPEMGKGDGRILRELAARVAELSRSPEEEERRRLWYRHNALEGVRPLIFCDPENGWNEIITQGDLSCEGELARDWEMRLRKEIFWGEEMCDDRVVEPYFDLPHAHLQTDWGLPVKTIGGKGGGSFRYDPPVKDYSQMDQLRYPEIRVDHGRTERLIGLAEEVFGDLLRIRLKGQWWWTLGLTFTLIQLRGLEQMMIDMYDDPAGLHRMMGFLRDATLHKLDFLEEKGLLALNNDGTYVGSGGFGYTEELPGDDFSGRVRTGDMWGFAESQETVHVSPEMFAEFIFPYQLPILERFGLNCYGCCEPLDERWEVVKEVPRLRRVSVSAWADLEEMAEKLEDKYIFSYKPSPSDLAVRELDRRRLRRDIRESLEKTRGCVLEIIMKDNHTIGGNPDNVTEWCRIAREEIEKGL